MKKAFLKSGLMYLWIKELPKVEASWSLTCATLDGCRAMTLTVAKARRGPQCKVIHKSFDAIVYSTKIKKPTLCKCPA